MYSILVSLLFKQLPDDFVFVVEKNARHARNRDNFVNNKRLDRIIKEVIDESSLGKDDINFFCADFVTLAGDEMCIFNRINKELHENGCIYCLNGDYCPVLSKY